MGPSKGTKAAKTLTKLSDSASDSAGVRARAMASSENWAG